MANWGGILLVSVIFINSIFAFNISPRPNLVFREPTVTTNITKFRSSYFGYSIVLRGNGVLVGAPRAQSSLLDQSAVNETGAIYLCPLDTQICEPYVFDTLGNVDSRNEKTTFEDQQKDFQWLGASIDGGNSADDPFVVCAPRMSTRFKTGLCTGSTTSLCVESVMNGICYWTPNTTESQPLLVRPISPINLRKRRDYHYGEQGLSVHISDNSKEIIIGAPGIDDFKGSIIRYRAIVDEGIGGISRRDTNANLHSIQKRSEPSFISYDSDVPYPLKLSLDSYFGYAVTTGYFLESQPDKLFYVASAPQANYQQGEVFIFDITDHGEKMNILYQFSSQQMGEYFGYALVAEDFNGDTFMDLAIAAPFHKQRSDSYDNGAVYIYQNLEGKSMELYAILSSDSELHGGRFGTTISKISDINGDGFNDLAVGAPYEGNGVVYIYLGSANGISLKPSQRILAPTNYLNGEFSAQSFGRAISKGADIDDNKYPDIAIGAPDLDIVYVYQTYPVAEVVAYIVPEAKEIKMTDTSFKLKACWYLISKHALTEKINFNVKIMLDQQHGRAKFPDNSNLMEVNDTAIQTETCVHMDATIQFNVADIFKHIDLEMSYEVLDGVPDSEVFCKNCIAVNPSDPKMVNNKVAFSTGCAGDRCIADLKLKSVIQAPIPYVIGSSKSLVIDYVIENAGESAYITQLNVSISRSVTFMRIPSSCRDMDGDLLCDINSGSPVVKDNKAHFRLTLDTSRVIGTHFTVTAHVFSTGDELNDGDNRIEDSIALTEFSDIEIIGKSSRTHISLEDGLGNQNIIHIFEIRNNGPSKIMNMDVVLSVPISVLDPWSLQRHNIIDFNTMSAKCIYENHHYDPEWSLNETILIQNPMETSPLPANVVGPDIIFVPTFINLSPPLNDKTVNGDEDTEPDAFQTYEEARRRRRSTYKSFNKYTQTVQEYHHVSRRSVKEENVVLNNLPADRSFISECTSNSVEYCVQARFSVHNFQTGNTPILISLNLTVELDKLNSVITEERDIFVLKTSASIVKPSDEFGMTFNVVQTNPYTIISKYHDRSTPIWVYIVSVLGGILLLVIITFAMYKFGFFKRTKKEEMEQIKRQSQALSLQAGTENIDL